MTCGPLRAERGSMLLELAIAMPVVLFLTFGIVQLTYLYRGKMQLDLACFRAARSAAVRWGSNQWEEKAKLSGRKVFTYWPNRKNAEFDITPSATQPSLGTPILVTARLPYLLRIHYSSSLYGKRVLELHSHCAWPSESNGQFVSNSSTQEDDREPDDV